MSWKGRVFRDNFKGIIYTVISEFSVDSNGDKYVTMVNIYTMDKKTAFCKDLANKDKFLELRFAEEFEL